MKVYTLQYSIDGRLGLIGIYASVDLAIRAIKEDNLKIAWEKQMSPVEYRISGLEPSGTPFLAVIREQEVIGL